MKSINHLFYANKGIFIIIFIAWLLFFFLIIYITNDLYFNLTASPSMKLESIGVLGDSFNILTSLFTGLAFAGVIVSVILQTKELHETKEEFKKQSNALEKQQLEMEGQSFDNKFFQMLNLLNNITEKLTIKHKYETFKGKNIFEILKNDLQNLMDENNKLYLGVHHDKFNYFKNVFNNFNNEHDTTFKYYFINLYQVLKYIDTYIKDHDEAKEYTNMLRAQLSKNELILLAYNAIGIQNFTTNQYQLLIEKYAFFEHLRYDDFCENPKIIQITNSVLTRYKDKAFGDNDSFIMTLNTLRFQSLSENFS